MKMKIIMALILLKGLTVSFAMAAPEVKKNVKLPAHAKLGTSFKFDGSSLRGKYQSSLNTAATVENDKLLEDLLNGRTQFEDRKQDETERN
jgi:hypothetical protein